LRTTSACHGSPMAAPASVYCSSVKPEAVPAPDSTTAS
jgi:hypothetical protein